MVQQSSSNNSEWPLRMSSQDALLTSSHHGASNQQLLVDGRGGGTRSVSPASGNGSSQLLQQQFPPPPPPEPWTQHQQQQLPPRGSSGQFANVMGGTLGRHAPMVHHGSLQGPGPSNIPNIQQYPSTFRGGGGTTDTNSYPLYHTCERPTNKKRVTIVEDNNTESSV